MVGLATSALRVSEAVGSELFWSVGTKGLGAVDVEIGCTTAAFTENRKRQRNVKRKTTVVKMQDFILGLMSGIEQNQE